ncbi:MAG: 50S ribosomal protein L21 [Candidatus Eremiobacteraeota bacterium]|nr:50S ribosomal protein L21 [Candidatus Eremiobacteraeota bacterium]
MYAIIQTGGKQYKVSEGDVIKTDLLESELGSDVTFDTIVLASKGGDTDAVIGAPAISGASVLGTVVHQGKGKKILVFRYKPKKRVRKLIGHRQRFAEIKITKISLP